MSPTWVQLCTFGKDGGIDGIPEAADQEYQTPKEGKDAAALILAKYPEVLAVWVRKVKDAHIRTIAMIERLAGGR